MKKLIALLLALIMVLALVACTGQSAPDDTGAQSNTEATGGNDAASDVDLGGRTFVLGDWWSAAVYEEEEPDSAWHQLESDYHHELESKMNFTWNEIGLQNQGEYAEVLVNSFISGEPVCDACWLPAEYVITMAAQGLLYDLSEMDAFDFANDSKWNQKIIDYFTINGKIYAARPSEDEPRLGILFNKRLLEEAGIDPELPYELQASGEWNWANFEDMCKKLCQDTNNDGVTDVYAMGGNDCELMTVGIYGNGAMFVGRDENGLFVNGTTDPAFEEGLNWSVSLIKNGYCREISAGDAWDKAYTDFANGQTAMLCCQTWIISSYLSAMSDDFGYVMLPAGPQGHCCTPMYPTPLCIPACVGAQKAQETAAVLNAWFDTRASIPEAEALGITFRDTYYGTFDDSRSVDETITAMVTDPDCQIYDSYYLVPTFTDLYYDYLVEVAAQAATAAEKIEALQPTAQAAIDAANAMFGN